MSVTSLNLRWRDDGNPPKMWFAKIAHSFENGHHVFTSPSIPGLFIAEVDPNKAFSQIIPLVQSIIFHTTKQKVQVFLGEDFMEFEKEQCSGNSAITTLGILPEAAIRAVKDAA